MEIVNYDYDLKKNGLHLKKKEMASWEYFYAVYIEVPQNLQFIEG